MIRFTAALFTYAFSRYLLSPYYVPGTVPGSGIHYEKNRQTHTTPALVESLMPHGDRWTMNVINKLSVG